MATNLATLYRNKPPIICSYKNKTRDKLKRNLFWINKPLKYGRSSGILVIYVQFMRETREEKC